MKADQIKAAVTSYLRKKQMAVNAEVGLCRGGRYRADLLALTFYGDTTVVEVKSSVADFKADKKWHNYLPFANKFYFAMTAATYSKVKDLIPKGIGVMLVSEFQDSVGRTRKSLKVAKPAYRREIEAETNINLIIRLAFRNADASGFARKRRGRKRKSRH
jgi:hypothetical protein